MKYKKKKPFIEILQSPLIIGLFIYFSIVCGLLIIFWSRLRELTDQSNQFERVTVPYTGVSPYPTVEPSSYHDTRPSPSPNGKAKTFQFGGFRISIPAKTAYLTLYEEPVEVRVSKVDLSQPPDQQCERISNLRTLFYYLVEPGVEPYSSSFLSWQTWSPDQLAFANASYKQQFEKKVSNLEKIFQVPDGDLDIHTPLDFNAESLIACGGAWFIPVYKQVIPNTGFDRVAYVEVNSGNGDAMTPPIRYIVIQHNNNWLITGEYPGSNSYPLIQEDLNSCFGEQNMNATLEQGVTCAAKIWKKYRSQTEINEWVKKVLDQID